VAFKEWVLKQAGLGWHDLLAKLRQFGLACFSECVDDILMWSHYADGHRGFCMEFNTAYPLFRKPIRLPISITIPSVNLADNLLNLKVEATSVMATKSAYWSYEKEWRAYIEQGNFAFQIDPACLTGIYFGCAMPNKHQEILVMMVIGSPTKLYKMIRSETQYKVKSVQVGHKPHDYSP
jgi:hypothetical protein